MRKHRAKLLRAGNYDSVEHFHGFNGDIAEYGAHIFPELSFGTRCFPCCIEEGTTQLLNLVDQEGQEHEHHKYPAEVFLAETVVMLVMVPLVLQCVESLVFHLPPSTASSHDGVCVFQSDGEIRNPAEVLRALWALFPVFQNIDQEVLVGRVDGDTVRKPKEMADLGIFWILHIVFDGLAFFNGGVQT